MADSKTSQGSVIAVRDAVVDVRFDMQFAGAELPAIDTALIVNWDRPEPSVLEVHSHVDQLGALSPALQPRSNR